MVLASDVVTGRGQVLIAIGVELTEKHLGGLRTWGITHVEIQGDVPGSAQVDTEFKEAAEVAMRAHFSNVDPSDRFVEALFEQCSQRRAEVLMAEKRGP
jgi:hypothetical protein